MSFVAFLSGGLQILDGFDAVFGTSGFVRLWIMKNDIKIGFSEPYGVMDA